MQYWGGGLLQRLGLLGHLGQANMLSLQSTLFSLARSVEMTIVCQNLAKLGVSGAHRMIAVQGNI